MASELAKEGVSMSALGVRGVWFRHDVETMKKRLRALEALSAGEGQVLTDSQVAELERVPRGRHARRVRE